MKRGVHVFLFLLLCAAAGTAQTPTPAAAESPAGVAVIKFNWERVPEDTGWDAPAFPVTSQTVEDPRGADRAPVGSGRTSSVNSTRERGTLRGAPAPVSAELPATQTQSAPPSPPTPQRHPMPARGKGAYVYRLRLKNGGERRVESVDWEYLFLDPETKKELARHRFTSPQRAKPSETFTLKALSASPPSRVVTASALGKKRKPFDERIVVRCVAYADGTFARREGAAESDCDGLREVASRARRQK
ncbi:MAG: hypothetical protein LC800_02360 [Acidobacteria bacterium]|nr:hypothetical protein [Acidobacteriota bacterium]